MVFGNLEELMPTTNYIGMTVKEESTVSETGILHKARQTRRCPYFADGPREKCSVHQSKGYPGESDPSITEKLRDGCTMYKG